MNESTTFNPCADCKSVANRRQVEQAIEAVMAQAQVFASTWSLVGGQFDNGSMLEEAEQAKAELKAMLGALVAQEPPMSALVDWAVGRWRVEVANRPLMNVHRRSLDDAWRQVLRRLGVDDRARLGPPHDELVAQSSTDSSFAKVVP